MVKSSNKLRELNIMVDYNIYIYISVNTTNQCLGLAGEKGELNN